MKKAIAAAILTVVCNQAIADIEGADGTFSGNQMKKMCNDTGSGKAFCKFWIDGLETGIIMGVYDQALRDDKETDASTTIGYCIGTKGVNIDQRQAIFVKYLSEHPERLHLNAPELYKASMKQAFPLPCKK